MIYNVFFKLLKYTKKIDKKISKIEKYSIFAPVKKDK